MLVSVGSGSNVDDPDTHPRRVPPRRRPRVHPRRQVRGGLRLRHPQLRRRSHQPHHRRPLVLHQRARQPRQPPRPRLRHLRPRRLLLRLALVLHGRPPGPAPPRALRQRLRPPTRSSPRPSPPSRPPTASASTCPPKSAPPTSSSSPTWPRSRSPSTPPAGRRSLQPIDGGAFAAEHGSWNRANRAGYEVIYIPMQNGHATGEYDDFLTGFVTPRRPGLGTPRRRRRRQGRLPLRHRRRHPLRLARHLHRQITQTSWP